MSPLLYFMVCCVHGRDVAWNYLPQPNMGDGLTRSEQKVPLIPIIIIIILFVLFHDSAANTFLAHFFLGMFNRLDLFRGVACVAFVGLKFVFLALGGPPVSASGRPRLASPRPFAAGGKWGRRMRLGKGALC